MEGQVAKSNSVYMCILYCKMTLKTQSKTVFFQKNNIIDAAVSGKNSEYFQ